MICYTTIYNWNCVLGFMPLGSVAVRMRKTPLVFEPLFVLESPSLTTMFGAYAA